jgi:hypothetical protein
MKMLSDIRDNPCISDGKPANMRLKYGTTYLSGYSCTTIKAFTAYTNEAETLFEDNHLVVTTTKSGSCEQNGSATGRKYGEVHCRTEALQLLGDAEVVYSRDFFPWPQYLSF